MGKDLGRRGFTLPEVIAAIVLTAALAAVLVPVFRTGLARVVERHALLAASYELRDAMERLVLVSEEAEFNGAGFHQLVADARFGAVLAEWPLSGFSWVEEDAVGNWLVAGAPDSAAPMAGPDHLLVELVHGSGPRLIYLFSRRQP